MPAILEVRSLVKRYASVTAVDGVSFAVPAGVCFGLLGPNGAGKTTTLRMLSGLMRPDGGEIRADDYDVIAQPIAAQGVMGLLPDSRGLYPRMTAREHIRYFGELRGLSGAELQARTERLVRRLGLDAIADRRVAGFSQGERTKVALARALVHRPRNVILDEPTNGLDVMAVRNLRALLQRLRTAGHCVLFSSHVMQEVAALCDSVVVIASGRVAASGSLDDLRALTGQQDLEEAFVRLIESQPPSRGAEAA